MIGYGAVLRFNLFLVSGDISLSSTFTIIGVITIGPSNKIFVRILFLFNSWAVILIEWTFYYLVMCKCMSTTVCLNDTVEFTDYDSNFQSNSYSLLVLHRTQFCSTVEFHNH